MVVEIQKINKEELVMTTSLKIAQTFEKEHKNVLQSIHNLGCSEEFSRLNFQPTSYRDTQDREQPMYYITRDGLVLLVMGYTGQKAMMFKEWYISQFNEMEKLLQNKLIEREKGIVSRQAMTYALKVSLEDERMHGHAYSVYTNFIYKVLFGTDANGLREKYQLRKQDNIRDVLSQDDLKAIADMEQLVSGLVRIGWGYDQIKNFIQQNHIKRLAA